MQRNHPRVSEIDKHVSRNAHLEQSVPDTGQAIQQPFVRQSERISPTHIQKSNHEKTPTRIYKELKDFSFQFGCKFADFNIAWTHFGKSYWIEAVKQDGGTGELQISLPQRRMQCLVASTRSTSSIFNWA